MILAIDPGKDKCGLAAIDNAKQASEKKVVSRQAAVGEIQEMFRRYAPFAVVIGKSAEGKKLQKELSAAGLVSTAVSEKNSTREARTRYWEENRPTGWIRFIPTTFRVPPVPVDDHAAVIIGERYLASINE
ncbi:MAG: Holliday junction resolvase RuvX [Candidatus Margulisbacteria bacterium]|nr:Holliday junction resolvase RuvX [Candidatus Margulisiibacteriota bacterium]MBU1616266.1 Holliday junction resolvase RuvX [Candidatus Margulisiibacteriota bacterium]